MTIEPDVMYKQVTVRLFHKGVVLRGQQPGSEIRTMRQSRVRTGQVLLSRIDARNGAIGLVPPELDGAIVTNDFWAFDVDKNVAEPRFLDAYFGTSEFVEACRRASEGTTNRIRLQLERFLDIQVPLPAVPEQRRIVARIECLSARIEDARTVKNAAGIQGKALFRVALNRILAPILPVTGTLRQVLREPPRNGWSVRCDGAGGGTPVLTLSAVTGFRYNPRAIKRTSEVVHPAADYWLVPGDLLITRSNTPQLVGHAVVYDGRPSPCIYPDLMMRCRIREDKADIRFVHFWLQSSIVREHVMHRAKGTGPTMKKIAQGDVQEIPFPMVGLDAQRTMVKRLRLVQDRVDALALLQDQTAAELEAMLASILNRALKEEL